MNPAEDGMRLYSEKWEDRICIAIGFTFTKVQKNLSGGHSGKRASSFNSSASGFLYPKEQCRPASLE